MPIPTLPESAPFSPAQRAWLNGFFAGLFSPEEAGQAAPAQAASAQAVPAQVAPAVEEDFPWHDPALPLTERLELAADRPFSRVLMASMAQLDCGSCGYLCQSYAEAIASGTDKDLSKCTPGGKETSRQLKLLVANRPADAEVPAPAVPSNSNSPEQLTYDRDNPFPAPILQVLPLTRKDSAKDVRFVSLGLRGSGLEYKVGDSLGVYPENCPDLVAEILRELDASGDEPVVAPGGTGPGRIVPARIALLKGYVINRVNEEFLTALAPLAAHEEDRHRLQHLALDDSDGFLEGRDVLDILHEFRSARPRQSRDVGALISSLAQLRPRLYSISSSPLAHAGEVHLTVGVVSYESGQSTRKRKGVCSTFLSDRLDQGHRVGVFVQPSHGFAPPANGDTPMIMVGPGTGIAPFRAFLQERRALGHSGRNWLFFGDQRCETDFLYQPELELLQLDGTLTRLDLAFSRDQAEKIYVQHRMLEHGAELWDWLGQGAHFYVCGDASRMAKDVDRALLQIAQQHGGLSEDGSRQFLAELAASGRYGRDVY